MSRDVQGREHLVRRQQALTAVFKRFAAVWPRAFAPSAWPTLMEPWMDALAGVDTDVLEPAARALLKAGQQPYPPKPWEYARVARQLAKQHAPHVFPRGADDPAMRSRVWEWRSPVTSRFSRAERRDDGSWIWHAIDDQAVFYGLEDAARVAYCEAMAQAHPMPTLVA